VKLPEAPLDPTDAGPLSTESPKSKSIMGFQKSFAEVAHL